MANDYASQAGHYYWPDGRTAYTVPAKKGGERATTIRDARELGLVPSVTTISACAAAPGLEIWKADQLMMAALTLPRCPDEPEQDWIKRVKEDSREQGKKAAERGTAIHGAIERVLLGQDAGEFTAYANGALAAVAELAPGQDWRPERSFAHPLGYGGKADLHSDEWLLDFKSKEFSSVGEVKLWDEHFVQLAAYREGLLIPNARCGIVFVSRSVPGLATIIECSDKEIRRGWKMFRALLTYYQAKNDWPWHKETS